MDNPKTYKEMVKDDLFDSLYEAEDCLTLLDAKPQGHMLTLIPYYYNFTITPTEIIITSKATDTYMARLENNIGNLNLLERYS